MNRSQSEMPITRSVALVGGNLSDGGGVNRVIRDLSTIFSERLGLSTTVLARAVGEPSYPFSEHVRIEYRPDAASRSGFRKLMREVSRRNIDCVIGFWHWDNIRIALMSALTGMPSIVTEHTSWHDPPLKTRMARALIYRKTKAVCVLNESEFDHYGSYLNNVVLLPNPVPKLAVPVDIRKEKLIVGVGHLTDRKNFRDAILAMHSSGLHREGWRLAIVGSGPEQGSLESFTRELGLEGAVRIEPPTSDIGQYYARASILLVTSKSEVFSMVLAESMQLNVVPLSYAVDGPAFILKDHPDLLIPAGNSGALGHRLRELALSGQLPDRGKEMMAVVDDRFSEEIIAERWKTLFGRS